MAAGRCAPAAFARAAGGNRHLRQRSAKYTRLSIRIRRKAVKIRSNRLLQPIVETVESAMKVLVVDDDVVSRMVLMHLIDSCGVHDIVEAEDGAAAWEQLEAGLQPAICFCDLRMPRLSGMALLARVRQTPALSGMRFVLASSASDYATMAEASGLGAGGYMVKPFERDLVLTQLAGLAPYAMPDGESPLATMARLGIDRERLLAYLAGFAQQLDSATRELGRLIASR